MTDTLLLLIADDADSLDDILEIMYEMEQVEIKFRKDFWWVEYTMTDSKPYGAVEFLCATHGMFQFSIH